MLRRSFVASTALAVACAATNPASHRFERRFEGRIVETPVPAPEAYAAYLEAALAYERGDDPGRALAAIDRAIAYDGRDPHPWVLRARILARAGRLDEARASLDAALARDPAYPPARALAASLVHPRDGRRARAGVAPTSAEGG
ncbi:MAG: tetratricopeptide repeat protein [Deltaproteobacteria bacterium]|nr:MAG: tetratricopeptide repeat protein [Deltaproteobacteria bacterium]